MASRIHTAFLSLTALGLLVGTPVAAQEASFSAAQKEELGTIIKEYLMDNPSVIMEAVESYRTQQEREAQKQAEERIAANIDALTSSDAPSVGNPEADVTVVEFFDYNCGYCKRALPDIQKVVDQDDNVRFVFQEMPILGDSSRKAAEWALAAHNQGKYFEYHVALMEHRGPKEDDQLEKLASDVGLDVEQMKKDIASGDIDKELQEALNMAREIGVSGTPAFIVGKTFIPGYIGEDGLKEAISQEREKANEDG